LLITVEVKNMNPRASDRRKIIYRFLMLGILTTLLAGLWVLIE
jgi:hypothetical protein